MKSGEDKRQAVVEVRIQVAAQALVPLQLVLERRGIDRLAIGRVGANHPDRSRRRRNHPRLRVQLVLHSTNHIDQGELRDDRHPVVAALPVGVRVVSGGL